MDIKLRLGAFVVVLLILTTALSMMFEQVSLTPLSEAQDEEDQTPWEERSLLPVESVGLHHQEIFYLYDSLGVSHLRCSVLTGYERGKWSSLSQEEVEYLGEEISFPIEHSEKWEGSMRVYRLSNPSFRLPVVEWTTSLKFEASWELAGAWNGPPSTVYSPEYQVFRLTEASDSSYFVYYDRYNFTQELLSSKEVGETNSTYLTVPDGMDRLANLAEFVTSGLESPYEKAQAIEDFLLSNHAYDEGYQRAPAGEDPVEWFLFESREGICTHFNSAFVLMARSIGIPARMVTGYLIDPDKFIQRVYLDQAHVYAEILLDDVGWITFDATGLDQGGQGPDEAEGGTVSGVVRHQGTGLEGQMVVLKDSLSGAMMTALTDLSGHYEFTDLTPGDYLVSVLPMSDMVILSPDWLCEFQCDGANHAEFSFDLAHPEEVSGLVDPIMEVSWLEGELYRNNTYWLEVEMISSPARYRWVATVFVYLVGADAEILMLGMDHMHIWHDNVIGFNISFLVPPDIPVGTYTLVVDFPGDTIWSGVEERLLGVKVRGHTSLVYDGPQELIAGLPQELHFALLEASSLDPMEGREVQVEIDGSIMDMETDDEGGFALNITPEEGELSIGLLYEGETLYDGNATEVMLQAFPPEVSFHDHRMVRGEENLMVGRAHAGDRPLPAQPVEIETDFWKSTNITSDHNGYLSIRIDVPAEMELGVHPSSFNLSGIGVRGGLELTVAARPGLELSLVGDRLTARLTDDRGDPIQGGTIRFKAPGLEVEAVTGEDGRTTIDVGSLEEGNVTVTFPGSDLYVGVTSTIDVGEGGLPLWLIAIVVMIGALGIASIARRSPGPKVAGERPVERRPEVVRMPSNIRFPDLPEGMPPVWEEGRPLRVIVEDARGLTARVDGQPVDGRWDGNDLMITLVLGKGAHRMSIEDETGSRDIVISIVDYREEMVRLYGDAVEGWERCFPRIGKSMTSMEMHSLLLPHLADRGNELTALIRLFEVANYSDHPVSRREYESLYRAFRRVAYG